LFTTPYSVTGGGSGACVASTSLSINVIGGPFAAPTATPNTQLCPGTQRNLAANLNLGVQPTVLATGGDINISALCPGFTIFGFPIEVLPDPYPSNMTVSGLVGTHTVANVKINGFNHAFPADMQIALVAPNGSKVLLLSNNGGGNPITGINLTFQDGSPNLPGTLTTGTFRTTTNTAWNGNSISAPFGSTLSSFSGSMNGTWRLYAWDDELGDGGDIDSWSITFNGPFQPFNFNGPVTYTWTATNGFTSTLPNPTDNPAASTTYTLTVADNSCSSSSQVSVQTLPSPTVSTFTGSPFCENGTIDFFTDGSGVSGPGSVGSLTVNVNGPGFLDETSWQIRNSSNVVIASGGPYVAGSNNTLTVNPSASDYPVTFAIETQGPASDNIANYSVTCSIGSSSLVSGSIQGGDSFSSPVLYCGSPSGTLVYSWSGPAGFTSNQ
jgi:subtilisin-like proprotein convertase family protein